ncbi:hypothetical protein B5M09_009480, partial [Aphanomyces astaci]
GNQVQAAVQEQSARLDDVQNAVGAQTRHTYEQMVHLHHQQQLHSQQQMEMNNRLMAELEEQRRRQEVLVQQLHVQKKQTEAHEQGLHQAAAASVKHSEQLEEMRRRTSARWHAFSATPVPAVAAPTTAPAVAGVQVVYGFQEVPKAPSFNGSTKVQMRKFMDQYEAYAREVNIANAQRPGGAQIQRAPLSACIDPLSVERIAYWEIGKASHELTEEDWKVFFLGAKDCDPVDMSKLDAAMAKLKMDTTVQSAESRVSKLVSDFEAVLVRLSMEGFAEAEPKLTVDYLVAAVQPPAVRARVKELMKLNENRSLKKDARDFKRWLADYMRRYGEFEPLMAAAVPATAKPDKLPAATKTPKAGKAPKVVAVVNVDKIPKSNFTQEKRACFKCLSTEHNVFKCPKVADGEAKLLMERARSIWKETKSVTVVETVDVAEVSLDNAVMCAARVVCVAGQAVSLDASFDSGADQSVVPPATLAKLKKQGRNVLVTKLKTPIKVKGFVGPAHTVTEEATMDLRFETDAGPLMLTNVKCWVSTGNLPANVGDILLSRAIMYKLGFDPRAMLREAASFTDAIDMADAVSHSGVVQAVLAVSHELVDDLAEEEEELLPLEMDSCFPDMVAVDAAAETAKVKVVLDAKVVEAVRYTP